MQIKQLTLAQTKAVVELIGQFLDDSTATTALRLAHEKLAHNASVMSQPDSHWQRRRKKWLEKKTATTPHEQECDCIDCSISEEPTH